MANGARTTAGVLMFGNVEQRFLPGPRHLPALGFGSPLLRYVWSGRPLNAAEQLLDATAARRGRDRVAIRSVSPDGEEIWTYGRLIEAVSRLAAGLRAMGIRPGERVLLRLPDSPQATVAQLAVWRIGAIAVPSSVLETSREIAFMLADTEATAVICASDHGSELEKALPNCPSMRHVIGWPTPVAGGPTVDSLIAGHPGGIAPFPSDPFDASGIYYTGGTSGLPKGCLHTHATELAVADLSNWARGVTPDSVFFTHAPIGHAFGNGEKINFPLRAGASVVYTNRPRPADMWEILARHDVTVLAGAPTMYRMMLQVAPDTASARGLAMHTAMSAGEALDPAAADHWADLTGVPLHNGMGMTPMRHVFVDSVQEGVKIAPGLAVGAPLPGYEARIVTEDGQPAPAGEPGRMAVRGPSGIAYWINQHPSIAERARNDVRAGWSHLDDAYVRDEQDWLWFHGRLDDMIVTGGRQVAPIEVERVLGEHPDVAEVCVVAAPDPVRGQAVTAVVRLRPGARPGPELAALLTGHAKTNLAAYKAPRRIEFVDELPKDAVGKFQRRKLRERFAASSGETAAGAVSGTLAG